MGKNFMKVRRGYGIEYKNLYSNTYCIIWSSVDIIADALYNIFLVLDNPDSTSEEIEDAKSDLEFFLDSYKVHQEFDIDAGDITTDNKYYLNDEAYIDILNASEVFEVYI